MLLKTMPINLQYCSDLHLEFSENKALLKRHPLKPSADILILAGDILPFSAMGQHPDFFDYISAHFKMTYWLPGNHEYYYSDISVRSGKVHEKIRDNIFLVNNVSVPFDGLKIIFSTLWSEIRPDHAWDVERSMSDFQVIRYRGRSLAVPQVNQLHADCLRFIKTELNRAFIGKTVVVTHHVPTFQHYPAQYKGSILNEAFAVELFPLIEESNIDYWIYGHHHANIPDFRIGNTVMLTNQMGYVRNGENQHFNSEKIITF